VPNERRKGGGGEKKKKNAFLICILKKKKVRGPKKASKSPLKGGVETKKRKPSKHTKKKRERGKLKGTIG